MTVCVLESTVDGGAAPEETPEPSAAFTIAADGSYAARLLAGPDGEGLLTERWTLDGPEPYAVRLPGTRPEEPDSEVLPLADGRVLIRRFADGRHVFALLYPTGPATGELPVGGLECERLALLPPAPDGLCAYALVPGERSTALWLVHGGSFGPEHIAEIPGRCSGGVWLDRAGRMLALDRTDDEGRTKAVAVDLRRSGEVSPLLQITEDSDDRLLLAEPDSGLLLLRSDAPGEDRLGWGVLGSALPVRFPDSLREGGADGTEGSGGGPGARLTPFALQPGQLLMPESCGVALRVEGPGGDRVGVWRPAEGQLRTLPAPYGWLAGTGLWTAGGELRLPYAVAGAPCGLARTAAPARVPGSGPDPARGAAPEGGAPDARAPLPEPAPGPVADLETDPAVPLRPMPLQQTPMARGGHAG